MKANQPGKILIYCCIAFTVGVVLFRLLPSLPDLINDLATGGFGR